MKNAPPKLQENLKILNSQEKQIVEMLLKENQQHLFATWEPPGTNDNLKHQMIQQLQDLNSNCSGGLTGYLSRARSLLAASTAGTNPFDGWVPKIPDGVKLEPFTEEYTKYESMGSKHLGKCGFVLVAGGLGERLGYHGIKIELPVETITHTCYLDYYISQILAIQSRYGIKGVKLPLAIMVSEDTEEKTRNLLEKNNYFGMEKSQITLMKQGKVPALMSNQAHIVLANDYEIDSKPHGHGDVHTLLHRTGVAKKWLDAGIEWITFFQDTNALAFFTLPAMLGVSVSLNLEVNSLAVPRFAKQSVGAITRLVRDDNSGKEMTINVEYNQLDPLLRSTISPDGDSNDPKTGLSPFPGNINQLLFRLEPYVTVLDKTDGLMPEFVNPKYKDESKTVFKKPTRLECMMQDYPRLLDGTTSKVGFTMAPSWICYSPCKNNAADAAASISSGVPAASALTAEVDQYAVFGKMLQAIGASIEEGKESTFLGITGKLSPRIIFHPSFGIFPHEIIEKFPNPSSIHISGRSTLILRGNVSEVDSLYLNGSLFVDAVPETSIIIDIPKEKEVMNAGHEIIAVDSNDEQHYVEKDRMRGYIMKENEMKTISRPHHVSIKNFVFDGVNTIDAEAVERGSRSKSGSGKTGALGIGGNSSSNSETCCGFFNC
jgi:UDP-sugar pyrophosphorylase